MPRKIDLGDKEQPQPKARPQETVRSEDFVSLYANNATVEVSPWDVQIRFGLISHADQEKLRITEVAQVYFSPQHAKALLQALQTGIAYYEKQYGEVPDPLKHAASLTTSAPEQPS